MDLLTRPQGISLPLAPVMAGAAGFAAAAIAGTLPTGLLEALVNASGLPAVVGAAEPPLGLTARLLLAIAVAALVGGALLPVASFHYGRRRLRVRSAPRAPRPVPMPRPVPARPISAHDELGAPFLSVKASVAPASAPAPAVTDMVEVADSVFMAERRQQPRAAATPPSPPPPPLNDSVSGLMARLEWAISSNDFVPNRPVDGGLRAAIQSLVGLRRTA